MIVKRMSKVKNLIFLLSIALLAIICISKANAGGNNTLQIIKYKNHVKHLLTKGVEDNAENVEYKAGAQFFIWKLNESEAQYPTQSILANLKSNSFTELDSKFGAHIVTEKTDENGVVELRNLEDGTYYGREVVFENGIYQEVIEDVPFVITLPFEGKNEVKIYPKSGVDYRIRLIKYQDEERRGNELAGVGFVLEKKVSEDKFEVIKLEKDKYDEVYIPHKSGELVDILYTDTFGEIRVRNLPDGEYRFREVKPLPGFTIVKEYSDVVDITKNESTTVTMINKRPPNGGKKFRKVDQDGKPLQGAIFKIAKLVKDANGKELYEDVTVNGKIDIRMSDEDGWFIFDNLPYGKYRLIETRVPIFEKDGYIISYKSIEEPIEFVIDQNSLTNGGIIKVVNTENPPDIPPGTPPPFIPPKPPIEVPNTGDFSLVISAIVGIILVGVGLVFIKLDRRRRDGR